MERGRHAARREYLVLAGLWKGDKKQEPLPYGILCGFQNIKKEAAAFALRAERRRHALARLERLARGNVEEQEGERERLEALAAPEPAMSAWACQEWLERIAVLKAGHPVFRDRTEPRAWPPHQPTGAEARILAFERWLLRQPSVAEERILALEARLAAE